MLLQETARHAYYFSSLLFFRAELATQLLHDACIDCNRLFLPGLEIFNKEDEQIQDNEMK